MALTNAPPFALLYGPVTRTLRHESHPRYWSSCIDEGSYPGRSATRHNPDRHYGREPAYFGQAHGERAGCWTGLGVCRSRSLRCRGRRGPHPAVMVDRPVVIISLNPASKSIVLLPGSLGAYINRAQNGGSARGYPRICHIADHTARTRESLIDRIFMHRHA